jgi:hypothetical protein
MHEKGAMQVVVPERLKVMPRAGVEPARPFGHRILSPVFTPLRSLTKAHPNIYLLRMALRNQGVADAVGMLVLKMSTASFQLSPSRFHTTTYLPLSVVVVSPAPGLVEV